MCDATGFEGAQYILWLRSCLCRVLKFKPKELRFAAASREMETIDIHLAEMAGWRALLSKAQFAAKIELHTMLEEYLVRMLFRTTKYSSLKSGDCPPELLLTVAEQDLQDLEDLRVVGDHCLMFAGLFPEQAIVRNLPISYFVKVGQAAYQQYREHVDEPIFGMLAEFFVDVMDVLQTLRELEHNDVCIDPLNAYHLWRDTGSAQAWNVLRRATPALPSNSFSFAIN